MNIPDSARMDFGDTLVVTAEALNGRGDSVAAQVRWAGLDSILQVDSVTGVVVARFTGTGQIQARTGNLLSNPQPISVFIRADTAFADSTPARDSISIVDKVDSLSDSIRVRVQNLGTGGPAGLAGRTVFYAIVYPDTTSFKLFVPGAPTTPLSGKAAVNTDVNGLAVVQVKLRQRTLPDSAVVQATFTRFNGATVPGMPVTFVVRFYP